ncbi:putative Dol-P-Glc:Glc(2)Man(9)GlcNAc(2)-PP-Dol alpha-1,2-glucosyltransferase [Sabethes cyaneus]|uniref:putative Dol-P-Glc:Glc(2)Man(9)GlcNAc(2)-PP-Dol alpha-1,2-glucosyltransferase n=1 Tax=Sabethes cyaneus TaxID=53552 RepID=UPI00237D5DF7|nr:putative Dol-P-Glc:Glc(2)Man(9)GlcNAc(2)-PP-Dol alpha-1,2-glucosyltransferase [Sabethes cyaneus]
MKIKTCFWLFLITYSVVTCVLFHLIYRISKLVVDEEFHLRQGENYCLWKFDVWDPKITTFPGLYLISALLLGPFKFCTTYALRLTSVLASIANVCFIFAIRRKVTGNYAESYVLLESASLALLPPLYFFSHLYYTDVLSVTMVLAMIYFAMQAKNNWGALMASLAVLMRQTNIVWVGFVLGSQMIDLALRLTLSKKKNRYRLPDLFHAITVLIRSPSLAVELLQESCELFYGYILVIMAFIDFLYWNGSIVVGDKTAHVAAAHIPQVFYFCLFFAMFSCSQLLTASRQLVRFAFKRWYISVGCIVLFAYIIKQNTIVHPYLLADNRHYTFYVWNRFYGRWWFARYLPIPVYYLIVVLFGFSLFGGRKPTVGYSVLWIAATLASVALQQLIEVRYFFLPFLVLRLMQTNIRPSSKTFVLELAINVIINAAALYMFCTKEFYWSDYPQPQRIIW